MSKRITHSVGTLFFLVVVLVLPLELVAALAAPNGSTLYNFQGQRAGDGAWPDGGLIADASGNLYGVTSAGGSSSSRLAPS